MEECDKRLGVTPILPKFGASFLNGEAVYRESSTQREVLGTWVQGYSRFLPPRVFLLPQLQ